MLKFSVLFLSTWLGTLWPPVKWESKEIRTEIAQIEKELKKLPKTPINTSPWTLGYSTSHQKSLDSPVSIDIHFKQPSAIDLVALMPATFTDDSTEVKAFCFPLRFSIEQLFPDGTTLMLANHLESDYHPPGIEPQLFSCANSSPCVGIRITITKRAPNPTWWQAKFIATLSEVMVFSGEQNVALNAEVITDKSFDYGYVWSPQCLTDGFTLFSPVDHFLTNPERNFFAKQDAIDLILDLGEHRIIDEFRLWPTVHSIQLNFPSSSGIGYPQIIQLQLASKADFSDARTAYTQTELAMRPGAGPSMHRIEPTGGRYVKLTLANGTPDFRYDRGPRIMLSEIEFFENGRIISRDIPVKTGLLQQPFGLNRLTDGLSNEGYIIPLRQWVIDFRRRTELETRLSVLENRLYKALQREEKQLERIFLVTAILILALAQLVWIMRVVARRRLARMRDHISCDLHDGIGANVSSIAHTAELLGETLPDPSETQERLLTSLIQNARNTAHETKNFIRFIESEKQDYDLTKQFDQIADQVLGTIPVSLSLDHMRSFNAMDPSTKWNLLLFYKEALNNIIKHAKASKVEVSTSRSGRDLLLTISDNGRGIEDEVITCSHLKSRGRMLGGTVAIDSEQGMGTRIILRISSKSKK